MVGKPTELTVGAQLWLSAEGQHVAGDKRIGLLAEVARLGSITRAAKSVGISYKGAWDAIEQMTNLVGEPLVTTSVGGKGGGRAGLTARAEALVHNFVWLRGEHARFMDRLLAESNDAAHDLGVLEQIAMKTSARNQFAGTVRSLREGVVNDEVELEIIGGAHIVATVTRDSRITLGLKPNSRAFALIKASTIMLVTELGTARLSARNQLVGKVSRITLGAVNSEVVIEMNGGGTVAAIITNESVKVLGLVEGHEATAVFKASSVILGVAA